MKYTFRLAFAATFLLFFQPIMAQTKVEPAQALTSLCKEGGAVDLGELKIKETDKNDFSNTTGKEALYIIELPSGFEFNNALGDLPKVTYSNQTENCHTKNLKFSNDHRKFSFQYTLAKTEDGVGFFSITGLKVKNTDASKATGVLLRTTDHSNIDNLSNVVDAEMAGNEAGRLNHGTLNAWKPQVSIAASVPINSNSISICKGDAVTFSGYPSGGSSYKLYIDGNEKDTHTSDNSFKRTDLQDGNKVKIAVTAGGCMAVTDEITVHTDNPPATPTLSLGDASNITTNTPPIALSGKGHPSGGTFSGFGVSNNKLYPGSFTDRGLTSSTITYTIKGSGACSEVEKSIDGTIAVSDISKAADFIKSDNPMPFCESGGLQRIFIIPSEGYFISTVEETHIRPGYSTSLSNPRDSTDAHNSTIHIKIYDFNPTARDSLNRVTLKVTFTKGTLSYISEGDVLVRTTTTAYIDGLQASYCASDTNMVTFKTYPSEGTLRYYELVGGFFYMPAGNFTINQNDSTFRPSELGVTSNALRKAIVFTGGKCSSSITRLFTVAPAPGAKDSIVTPFPYCKGDTLLIKNLSSSLTTNDSLQYTWDWGDGFVENNSDSIVKHFYLKPDKYLVKLKVSSLVNACSDVVQDSVHIGVIPMVAFDYKNNCGPDSVAFSDITLQAATDSTLAWKWDFGIATTDADTAVIPNPKYKFDPGYYNASLKLTNESGCFATKEKQVSVFKILEIKHDNSYTQHFESSNDGEQWIPGLKQEKAAYSWKLKAPQSGLIRDSGNVWITNNDSSSYNSNEVSYVESPCFLISDLERPMASFRKWDDLQEGIDGVIFQYCIDNGSKNQDSLDWKLLGDIEQGEFWYNTNGIITNPGNQIAGHVVGWSSIGQEQWQTAKIALDEIQADTANIPVRFRFLIAADSANPSQYKYEGFAFDDFFIGERKRHVLMEHFNNTLAENGEKEEKTLDAFYEKNKAQLILLTYHPNYPGKDPVNLENTADPSARALLYGLSETPRTVMDGLYMNNDAPSFLTKDDRKDVYGWGPRVYSERALSLAYFDLNVTAQPVDTAMKFTVTATRNAGTEGSVNIIIQTVIAARWVKRDNRAYLNVAKKNIPNAAGTRVGNWLPGEQHTANLFWTPRQEDLADTGYYLVVFLQDEDNKSIYQATRIDLDSATIASLTIPSSKNLRTGNASSIINSLRVYPNPASNRLNLRFSDIVPAGYTWQLLNLFGMPVKSGQVSQASITNISITSLREGVYTLQILKGGSVETTRKVCVFN